MIEIQSKIAVYMDNEEAKLFIKFQERLLTIVHIIGIMDGMNITDISNANLSMDFNDKGIINHATITKHYRS